MTPDLTSSSTTITRHLENPDRKADVLAPAIGFGDRVVRAQAQPARGRLTPASVPVWRHKLILAGRLDHHTAVELEDEIDCLCEEGVTTLTLDLRQLGVIDPVGARAIACRGAACRRRGCDFAVLPGSPVVRHALAEAGGESLLAGDPGEAGVVRLVAGASDSSSRDTSTVMIKNL